MNACRNRAPFRDTLRVQAGWVDSGPSRAPVMRDIPFRMTRECVYGQDVSDFARRSNLGAFDPRCAGCCWRADAP